MFCYLLLSLALCKLWPSLSKTSNISFFYLLHEGKRNIYIIHFQIQTIQK